MDTGNRVSARSLTGTPQGHFLSRAAGLRIGKEKKFKNI